jgi:hypothetical protein
MYYKHGPKGILIFLKTLNVTAGPMSKETSKTFYQLTRIVGSVTTIRA